MPRYDLFPDKVTCSETEDHRLNLRKGIEPRATGTERKVTTWNKLLKSGIEAQDENQFKRRIWCSEMERQRVWNSLEQFLWLASRHPPAPACTLLIPVYPFGVDSSHTCYYFNNGGMWGNWWVSCFFSQNPLLWISWDGLPSLCLNFRPQSCNMITAFTQILMDTLGSGP